MPLPEVNSDPEAAISVDQGPDANRFACSGPDNDMEGRPANFPFDAN